MLVVLVVVIVRNVPVKMNCVTQLMLYTGDKLSSPIFCCL